MIIILELNFLIASGRRVFASFEMFQHIASSVSFLKMFLGKLFVICCKRQAIWVLSFSRCRLLKGSPERVSVISAVKMASLLGRKVSEMC